MKPHLTTAVIQLPKDRVNSYSDNGLNPTRIANHQFHKRLELHEKLLLKYGNSANDLAQ